MAKKPSIKKRTQTKRVQFDFHAPEAKKVSLAGDFNGWDVAAVMMKKKNGETWTADISLEPGRYEYRFYSDGAWCDDSNASDRVENPFGTHNCVRVVG